MKRNHRWRKCVLFTIAILFILIGTYLFLLIFWPQVDHIKPRTDWNYPVAKTGSELTENRLYIPRLKLNLAYKAGDRSVLNNYIWHRYPERGNPEKGGNFILAGHRFEIGFTPGETRRKSPFYSLNQVERGDYVYADWNGKRYKYQVTRKYKAESTQVEIESSSEIAKMTLYTCTLKGEADGRDVLETKLIQVDVSPALEMEINNPA